MPHHKTSNNPDVKQELLSSKSIAIKSLSEQEQKQSLSLSESTIKIGSSSSAKDDMIKVEEKYNGEELSTKDLQWEERKNDYGLGEKDNNINDNKNNGDINNNNKNNININNNVNNNNNNNVNADNNNNKETTPTTTLPTEPLQVHPPLELPIFYPIIDPTSPTGFTLRTSYTHINSKEEQENHHPSINSNEHEEKEKTFVESFIVGLGLGIVLFIIGLVVIWVIIVNKKRVKKYIREEYDHLHHHIKIKEIDYSEEVYLRGNR